MPLSSIVTNWGGINCRWEYGVPLRPVVRKPLNKAMLTADTDVAVIHSVCLISVYQTHRVEHGVISAVTGGLCRLTCSYEVNVVTGSTQCNAMIVNDPVLYTQAANVNVAVTASRVTASI